VLLHMHGIVYKCICLQEYRIQVLRARWAAQRINTGMIDTFSLNSNLLSY